MILVNGVPSDSVLCNDRGLSYGDGVFRTMKRVAGRTLCWSRHYAKLADDCARLRLACPERALLEAELALLPSDCVAKVVVTRGAGGRGYAFVPHVAPTRIVSATPLPTYAPALRETGVAVRLCELRLGAQPALAGIKHLNRLENVLARMEWDDPAISEGLLRDEAGSVVEGTMSNVFAYHGGELLTPDLARCGVAGVQRERVMAFAAELGIPVRVAALPLEVVMAADEVLLVNSVFGLWAVREFNGRIWRGGDLAEKLRAMVEGRDD